MCSPSFLPLTYICQKWSFHWRVRYFNQDQEYSARKIRSVVALFGSQSRAYNKKANYTFKISTAVRNPNDKRGISESAATIISQIAFIGRRLNSNHHAFHQSTQSNNVINHRSKVCGTVTLEGLIQTHKRFKRTLFIRYFQAMDRKTTQISQKQINDSAVHFIKKK